jgi:hypothetical protein
MHSITCSHFIFSYHDFTVHRQHEDENRDVTSELLIGLQPGVSECSDATSSSHMRSSDIRPPIKFEQRKSEEQEVNWRSGSSSIMRSSPCKRNLVTNIKRSSSRQTVTAARKRGNCSKNGQTSRKLESHWHRICLKAKTIRASMQCHCFLRVLMAQPMMKMLFGLHLSLFPRLAWGTVGSVFEAVPLGLTNIGSQDPQIVCSTYKASDKQVDFIFCFYK